MILICKKRIVVSLNVFLICSCLSYFYDTVTLFLCPPSPQKNSKQHENPEARVCSWFPCGETWVYLAEHHQSGVGGGRWWRKSAFQNCLWRVRLSISQLPTSVGVGGEAASWHSFARCAQHRVLFAHLGCQLRRCAADVGWSRSFRPTGRRLWGKNPADGGSRGGKPVERFFAVALDLKTCRKWRWVLRVAMPTSPT